MGNLLAYVAALFVDFVSELSVSELAVAQMRGEGALNLRVVESNPGQQKF